MAPVGGEVELARAARVHVDLEGRADDQTVKSLGTRVSELMLRILHIAEQCRTIENDLSAAPAYELEERIGQLSKKAEGASDSAARRTYETAIASLDERGEKVVDTSFYVLFNAHGDTMPFTIPPELGARCRKVLDTSELPAGTTAEVLEECTSVDVAAHSLVLLEYFDDPPSVRAPHPGGIAAQ